MRRALLALVLLVPMPVALHAAASAPPSFVVPPLRPGLGQAALLVLLPDAGRTASDHAEAARAAQLAAGHVRLWVAAPAISVAPADAEVAYRTLLEEVRAQGFRGLSDADVVVAGWGRGALAAQQLGTTHALAGVAAVGDPGELTEVDLRLLGELDRSAPVVATAATQEDVLVLPAAGATDLRGPAAGAVLGDLVEELRGRSSDLTGRLAADRLVAAVHRASAQQAGQVCAELQRHTADLAAEDSDRITVTNRADADLMAPTPDGVAAGDLGGFLYDKAELRDDGTTARLTTNSHVVAGAGPAATEVMCKTKSRSAVAQAVYDDFSHVDGTAPTCAGFTEATLAWARSVLSASAVARSGGVTVLADQATSAGPQWVFTPMTVTPVDLVTGRWQVQSPSLVTELSDTDLDPEFAGNHYCKVLSPVRALQLVLEDTAPFTAG